MRTRDGHNSLIFESNAWGSLVICGGIATSKSFSDAPHIISGTCVEQSWRTMVFYSSSIALAISLALTLVAATTISPSAQAACSAISAAGIETLTSEIDFLYPDYIIAQSHYWSAADADLIPACAVFPVDAQDVSRIVIVLLDFPSVDFAVKSGGHNPNVGYSSVEGGVLISMSKISSTDLSADQTTADIGTGSRWIAVAQSLDPYNLTVVSGRLGISLLRTQWIAMLTAVR